MSVRGGLDVASPSPTSFRLSPDELDLVRETASAAGVSVSEYVRQVVVSVSSGVSASSWEARRVHLSVRGAGPVEVERVGVDTVIEDGVPVPTRSYVVVAQRAFFEALSEGRED